MDTSFAAFWEPLDAIKRADFALRAKTSVGMCQQIAGGFKKVGPRLAVTLADASDGVLRASVLCPRFPWHLVQKAA